ncbi:MAG TPA: hypothetical protein PKW14_11000 [Bacteroidota bacterium]|nr:hypothetical protein [Bacteroidota bacterium]
MKINRITSVYKTSNKSQSNIHMNKKQQQQQKNYSDKFIDVLKNQIGKGVNNKITK